MILVRRLSISYLCFVGVLLLFIGMNAQAGVPEAWAEKEKAAGQEIYIPGVRLVRPEEIGGTTGDALATLGVDLAYVTEITKPGNGKYTCTPLSEAERLQSARIITASLKKLGGDGVRKLGLKYVLLCETAQAGGRDIGGIPVPPIRLLMLAAGSISDAYRGRIFFHELYHYIDFTMRGGLKDMAWDKQFGTGYGGGYGTPDGASSALGGGAAGFASRYAQTLPEEDRAEVFSFLMTDAQALKTYAAQKQDKVLQAKIAYIETVIQNQLEIK